MTHIQPDAYPEYEMDKRKYQSQIKEHADMYDKHRTMLTRRYGGTGRSTNGDFDRAGDEVSMTLAHLSCYERKRTGARLTHNSRNERPRRLYLADTVH